MIAGEYEPVGRGAARWALAAALVAVVHIGIAFATLRTVEEPLPDEEPSGVISIELAPISNEINATVGNLAPTPGQAEATPPPSAAAEAAKEPPKPEKTAEQLPPAPSPNDDTDARLPEKQVTEDKPHDTKVERQNETPKETTEAPKNEVAPAIASETAQTQGGNRASSEVLSASDQSAASRQGRSKKPSTAQIAWQKSLVLEIERHKQYPGAARRKRLEGTAVVGFTLDRQGHIVSSRLIKSSSSDLLDSEAVAVLARADPLPSPPSDISVEGVELVLPVRFRFQD